MTTKKIKHFRWSAKCLSRNRKKKQYFCYLNFLQVFQHSVLTYLVDVREPLLSFI